MLFETEDVAVYELLSKLKSERSKIRTLQFTLKIRVAAHDGAGRLLSLEEDSGRLDEFSIWKTPESLRIDQRSRHILVTSGETPLVPKSAKEPFESRLAITGEKFIEFQPREYSDSGYIVARSGNANSDQTVSPRIFDPLMIGNLPFPYGLWHRTTLSQLVPDDQTKVKLRPVTLANEIEALRYELDGVNGLKLTFVVVPSLGDSVAEAMLERNYPNGSKYRQRVSVAHRNVNAVWFPTHVRYSSHVDERLIGEEEWLIEDLVVNESIAASLFTPEGLEIPNDYIVSTEEAAKQLKDGKLTSFTPSDPQVVSGSGSPRSCLLYTSPSPRDRG